MQISKDELNTQSKCRKKIIYFGRIDEEQKNLSLLLEINKKINLIDFYGEGNLEIIKQLGDSYKGYINPLISPLELINKYKFMILMSKHEGFSFSLVQALACGVPIIVRDTFINASYLTNNNQNGFLLNNNLTIEEYATQIKDIYSINENEYLQLCKNAYNFACRNLSESEFINK
ncbi:glycosyltransferase [bacterium]|nr:glycosyltransferase [bacterium]